MSACGGGSGKGADRVCRTIKGRQSRMQEMAMQEPQLQTNKNVLFANAQYANSHFPNVLLIELTSHVKIDGLMLN